MQVREVLPSLLYLDGELLTTADPPFGEAHSDLGNPGGQPPRESRWHDTPDDRAPLGRGSEEQVPGALAGGKRTKPMGGAERGHGAADACFTITVVPELPNEGALERQGVQGGKHDEGQQDESGRQQGVQPGGQQGRYWQEENARLQARLAEAEAEVIDARSTC